MPVKKNVEVQKVLGLYEVKSRAARKMGFRWGCPASRTITMTGRLKKAVFIPGQRVKELLQDSLNNKMNKSNEANGKLCTSVQIRGLRLSIILSKLLLTSSRRGLSQPSASINTTSTL